MSPSFCGMTILVVKLLPRKSMRNKIARTPTCNDTIQRCDSPHEIDDFNNQGWQINSNKRQSSFKYLPFTFGMCHKLIEGVCVVKLKEITDEEERKQKAESSPHPRMESFNGDIHVMAFTQGFQSIQTALLVSKLKKLYKT